MVGEVLICYYKMSGRKLMENWANKFSYLWQLLRADWYYLGGWRKVS